jgi:signal transduction histidine kinase
MLLVRNNSFFNYWMYISLGGALLFMKSGISLEILWPSGVFFDFALRNFLLYAYLIFTLQFLKEFLRKRMDLGVSRHILNGLIIAGVVLGISYFVLSYLFKEWVDALLIIQTVYTNITNVVVTLLFVFSFSKIKERLLLSVFFVYYLTFSLYLFNPFLEFGFWIGNALAFVMIYSGGIFIALLLVAITALRTRNVFDNNRDMKRELGTLNRSYTYSLLEGQEKERKRVAEELHDGIGVLMSTIKMKLSLLSDKIPAEKSEELTAILNNVDESCQHIRELSHELMPPTLARFGLYPALTDMLQEYERNYPVKLSLKTNVSQVKMTTISHIALYRLVHYLLEAVVHAQCKRAELKLFVFPSVSNATLRIDYSGGYMHPKQDEYKKLKELINLFQGRMDNFMSNIWDDELEIEIPVVMIEDEKPEITS